MLTEDEFAKSAGLKVGDMAPDFSLVNTDGEIKVLSQLYKSSPLIVNFFRGSY
ncbi:hypothetical protein NEF87_000301 [Candidatus Lokiarchaeum ossiferum]|uniref:Alkyl hydroperoxide reductase subunit C/ Thiol specific antioxidant domain-containing protein n=1 Tax=Candidatus Lokiarchaeum ossiferum TaxID=2951803 RepID=A0ABY6HKS3_9ARCH|nr:hypothetical protein NEF87_000301 [Candidatus Lokiarchaeum sp. B-35]